jgi:2-hydroxychromene-2-carboxylate isomerase
MCGKVERRAAKYGLPIRLPVPYPAPDPVRANRIAIVGMHEGSGPAYVRAAYRLWFAHGIGTGSEENLRASLAECGQGQEIARILGLDDSVDVGHELEAATDEARPLGVIGSPTLCGRDRAILGR